MRRTTATATVAMAALALARGAVANNNWSTSYRGGTVSLPAAEEHASNRGTGVAVNNGRIGYSIPIEAPPGVRGMTPSLSIDYTGSRMEGPLGAQWTLAGVPTLSVRTSGRGGQPVYGVGVTYLGLSGEELVPVETAGDIDGDGTPDATYREERDRLFARYIQRSTGGWRIDQPDGRKLTLGTTSAARIARADAAYSDQIWTWLPETLEDPQGNQLLYVWADAATVLADASARSDVARYLTEVRYACQACATATAYQRIALSYASREAAGAEPVLDARPGFVVEWEAHLSAVDTYTHTSASTARVRRYTPGYTIDRGRMLLASVATTGDDGTTLPALSFTYTDADAPASPTTTMLAVPLNNGIPVAFTGDLFPADMDGDGRIDLVKCQAAAIGTYRWWRNIGVGDVAFAAGGTVYGTPPAVCPDPADPVSLEDSNRDLRIDVQDFSAVGGGVSVYEFVDAVTGWAPAVNAVVSTAGSGDDLFRRDVNRDGYVDLVTTSAAPWTISFDDSTYDYTLDAVTCSGTGGAGITPTLGVSTLATGDSGVVMADVTGDDVGETLFVDISTASGGVADVHIWPGRGRGCFGFLGEDGHGADASYTTTITGFVDGVANLLPDADELQAADVDGDGLDDLIWLDSAGDRVGVWTYDPTTGFVPAFLGAQAITSTHGCRIADFEGDGASNILCSLDWKLYDFADGQVGHLETTANGRGVTTTISYTTSARMAAEAEAANHAWTTNVAGSMPFASQLVVEDGRDNREVRTFTARDAYYKRDTVLDIFEVVGFAYVEETRTAQLFTGTDWMPDARDPGHTTRTWFDVGATEWALRGATLCEETWTPGTEPTTYTCGATTGALSRVETSYELSEDSYGVTVTRATTSDRYVLEGTAGDQRIRNQVLYDDHGNAVVTIAWGKFRPGNPLYGADEAMTVTDWITDPSTWLLRSPKRTMNGRPTGATAAPVLVPVSASFSYYDGNAAWDVSSLAGGLRTKTARWACDPTAASDPRCASAGDDANAVVEQQVTYTSRGLVDVVTNAENVPTTHAYDAAFGLFLTGTTLDPTGLNLTTSFVVDPRHGGTAALTGPDGSTTRASYDSLARMIAFAKPGDTLAAPTTMRTYLDGAPISTIVDVGKDGTANGLVIATELDGHGRLLCRRREAPGGVHVEAQHEWSALGHLTLDAVPYDAAGACMSSTVAVNLSLATRTIATDRDEHTVDALGRELAVVHSADGSRRTWTHGVLQVTYLDEEDNGGGDHANTERVQVFDGAGHVVRVAEEHQLADVDPGIHAFDYLYTFDGKLARVTDSTGVVIHTAAYDARRRLMTNVDATRGTTTFGYDDVGRITSTTDARGENVAQTYDHASRPLTTSDSTGVTTYQYDTHPDPTKTASCNTAGRPSRVVYPAGETTYCYDTRGRMKSESTIVHSLGAPSYVTSYLWDSLDRLTRTQYPDQTRSNLTYGPDGWLDKVQAWSGPAAKMVVTDVQYTAWGAPLAISLGNGATLGYEHDGRARPERSTVDAAAGRIQNLRLTLDLVGNVTAIADGVGFASAAYAYDDLYRIVEATGARYGGETASYEYDRRGNLTRKGFTDATSPLDVGPIAYADPAIRNAVSSAGGQSFTYDAMGNLTSDGVSTFTFTPTGMLHRVLDAAGVEQLELEYDHAGRRIAKLAASGSSVHYFPGAELRDDGTTATWEKPLAVGGRVVGRFDGTFTAGTVADHVFFVATDHLGSPSLVMNTAGAVIERYDHHPHGEESLYSLEAADAASGTTDFTDAYFAPGDPASKLTRRFQGREVDSETGKYNFDARIHDPTLGRFLTADAIVPDPLDSQSWNRYAFVRNNPLAFVDPSGHEDVSATKEFLGDTIEPPPAGAEPFDGVDPQQLGRAFKVDTVRAEWVDGGGGGVDAAELKAATRNDQMGEWHLPAWLSRPTVTGKLEVGAGPVNTELGFDRNGFKSPEVEFGNGITAECGAGGCVGQVSTQVVPGVKPGDLTVKSNGQVELLVGVTASSGGADAAVGVEIATQTGVERMKLAAWRLYEALFATPSIPEVRMPEPAQPPAQPTTTP
jgi:RHS repeat-associated protein